MKRGLQIALGVLALIVVAGGSFYGGMVYGKGQAQATLSAAGGRPGQGGFAAAGQAQQGGAQGAGGQGSMTGGTIEEISDGILVLVDTRGNKTQVKVTDTTLIQKQMSVKATDLAKGDSVLVSGSKDNAGVITARSLQVVPAGRFSTQGPDLQQQTGGQGTNPQGPFPGAPGGMPGGAPGR